MHSKRRVVKGYKRFIMASHCQVITNLVTDRYYYNSQSELNRQPYLSPSPLAYDVLISHVIPKLFTVKVVDDDLA